MYEIVRFLSLNVYQYFKTGKRCAVDVVRNTVVSATIRTTSITVMAAIRNDDLQKIVTVIVMHCKLLHCGHYD